MFCRLALPKFRTLTADDEVILCSWQRVNAPELLYVTCNVNFTVDFAASAGIDTYKPVNIPFRCPVADKVADLVIFSLRATILINLNLNLTWSQTCVSCACCRPVESWSKANCEPVCDQVQAISTCRDSLNLSAICFRPKKSRELVADPHELVGNRVLDQATVDTGHSQSRGSRYCRQ